MPALLTSTSSRPNVSRTFANSATISSSRVRSAACASASPPLRLIPPTTSSSSAARRATSTVLAPSAAKVSAMPRPMPWLAPVTIAILPCSCLAIAHSPRPARGRSVDRHEDRVSHLSVDRLRQVALAADVLHQQHLAGADHPLLAVARGDLDPAVQVDDVLPARRRMPVEIVVTAGLAEDDARRRQAPRQLATRPILDPFDLDVAKMRLTLGVDIDVVDAHFPVPHDPKTISASSAVAPCPSACTISGLTSISVSSGTVCISRSIACTTGMTASTSAGGAPRTPASSLAERSLPSASRIRLASAPLGSSCTSPSASTQMPPSPSRST